MEAVSVIKELSVPATQNEAVKNFSYGTPFEVGPPHVRKKNTPMESSTVPQMCIIAFCCR
jgi:hypothetical protein